MTEIEKGSTGMASWHPALTAPFDQDLELAVIDNDGPHVLVFPCRRVSGGWVDADSKRRIDVDPTHWRVWKDKI